MKTYKVRYLDKDRKEKTATDIEGTSNFDARIDFIRKYAGKHTVILSILSLGKNVKPSQ